MSGFEKGFLIFSDNSGVPNLSDASLDFLTAGSLYKPHFSVMIFGNIDKPKNVFVFFNNKITSINF